jgi:ParB/RepB/Spo0J family partition protein
MKVPINQIMKNPYDTREDYGDLEGLKTSIRQHGMLIPHPARPGKNPGEYELAFGGRRLQSAKEVGISEVELQVQDFKDSIMPVLALNENVHRKDLNPVELAKAYRVGLATTGYNIEEFSKLVGESSDKINNYLSILELPEQTLSKHEQYNVIDLVTLARLEKISRTLRITYENVLNERTMPAHFANQIVVSCRKVCESNLPQNKKVDLCGDIITQDYSTIAPKNAHVIGVYSEQRLEQALITYNKNLGKVAKAIQARKNNGPARSTVKKVKSLDDIEDVNDKLDKTTDILRTATLHLERTEKKGYYTHASKRNQKSFRVAVNKLASRLEGILKNDSSA